MMQLPRKVAHFTLMRRLGADGIAESYVAILDEPAGKQVVARRIHSAIVDDEVLMARIRARVGDLVPIRHPAIATVHGIEEVDGDAYVIEDWVDGLGLDAIAERARSGRVEPGTILPHNVFLDMAAQVCNGLEALHGRPGQESGSEHVLHLGMSPQSIVVRENGQLALCGLGLVSTPTILPQGASGIIHLQMEYLAPEQTHPEQSLSPATDLFSLGTVLYELLTLKPMFRAPSNLQTIHRVRKAEVTTELLEVKDLLPGLDRVLYRALSVKPRHRYQRAFVLREDLRGLMAGYSFADIQQDARGALAPYLTGDGWDEVPKAPAAEDSEVESTAALLGDHTSEIDHDANTIPPRGTGKVEHDAPTMPEQPADAPIPPRHATGSVDHDAPTMPEQPADAPIPSRYADEEPDTETSPGAPALPEELPPPGLGNDADTASFLRAVQGMGESIDPTDAPARAAEPNSGAVDDTMAHLRAAGAGPMPEPKLDGAPDSSPPEDMPIAGMAPRQEALDAPALSVLDTEERPSPPGDSAPPSPVQTIEQATPAVVADAQPDPARDAEAAAVARKRLAPADSLIPPASEPPAVPRKEAPTLPMPRPEEAVYDDDLEPTGGGFPVAAVAVVGGIAAVAIVFCVGMGGLGTWFGASQMAANTPSSGPQAAAAAPAPEVAAAEPTPAPEAPDPKPAAPAPKRTQQAAAAPRLRPQPVPSRPAPPAPRPTEAPRPTPPPRPAPVATAPPPPEPTASTYDAIAAADDVTQQEQGTADELPVGPLDRNTLDRLAGPAFSGSLAGTDRGSLAAVSSDDPLFTRAYTLLYLDAKARGDITERDRNLASLMALPENQYNPALLVEEAWVAMGRRDWSTALARSERAERHWARLPSDLIFGRKALIYEIQAKAHLGSFYASEGDDATELDQAIKGWQRYKRHAETQARSDLMATADQQLARLYDIQRRLE